MEREIIRERTKAGLDAAKARGRSGGRPRIEIGSDRVQAVKNLKGKMDVGAIAALMGISRATVYRYLKL